MLEAVVSWPSFLVALLVFGFVPGALLRLIVLAFDRDDPRRYELLAELYRVPRMERPFWVLEQLELALCEGIRDRIIWAATGRIIHRWRLSSGVKRNRAYPETFDIPSEAEKRLLVPGMTVKLMFETKHGGERMWVDIVDINRRRIVGTLRNTPTLVPRLDYGDKVKFKRDHIIGIVFEDGVCSNRCQALGAMPPRQR